MLDPQELSRTASAFGVAEEQVRRDHLISHVLAALAQLGALNEETASLVQRVTGWAVGPYVFRSLPKFDWHSQLAHQTHDLPPAADCLTQVRDSYADALNWNHD